MIGKSSTCSGMKSRNTAGTTFNRTSSGTKSRTTTGTTLRGFYIDLGSLSGAYGTGTYIFKYRTLYQKHTHF